MGILRLESFLTDTTLKPPPPFQQPRSLRALASPPGCPPGGPPPSLFIDANGFVFFILERFGTPPPTEDCPRPELLGADLALVRSRTAAFVAALRLAGVRPEFCWDGALKDAAKDATGSKRRVERNRDATEVVAFCETGRLPASGELRVGLGALAWAAVS